MQFDAADAAVLEQQPRNRIWWYFRDSAAVGDV